ncbi:InlB B-repeat-containing protein [Roseburia intestinalis]|uniref:InlB B-repeat-containing protein n=1 Tax=Roseburia intestinalis TaxID=166486 RepID=UPI001FAB9667|nr:InlB B-repeat-containing protein [Roseburia intestinalis]
MKGGMKKAFTALLAATVLVGGMPVNMQANVIAETEKAESTSEKVNEKYADTEELDLMDRERQETQAGEQEKRENTEQPESEETEQPDTEEQSEETEQPDTEEQPEETEQPDTETELPEMEEETEEREETSIKGDASEEQIAAEQKAWTLINKYADPDYFLTDPERNAITDAQFEELRQAALQAVAGCTTQYEKIKAIMAFVADRTYYDYYAYYNNKPSYWSPYEVYEQKRAMCSGYASLMRTLCISIGIPCMDLEGHAHEYNAVYDSENGKWIFADATWCSRNSYSVDKEWEYQGYSDRYFDLSPEEIAELSNHQIYRVDGLLKDGLYYSLISYRWSRGNWYFDLAAVKNKNIRQVKCGGFEDIDVLEVNDGAGVFADCTLLEEADLSQTGITVIESRLFLNCTSLKTVKLPKTLTMIYGAFENCTSLEKVDLSQTGITELEGTFEGCSALETVKLPENITKIGFGTFTGCSSLEKMDLSQTLVTEIGGSAFSACSGLKTVKFPKTLTAIDSYAFLSCKNLTGELDLSQTAVKTIGICAFYKDGGVLGKIRLPKTITEIGSEAFSWETTDGPEKIYVITSLSKDKINAEAFKRNVPVVVCPYLYTIKFDGNGAAKGKMSEKACAAGQKEKLSKNKFEKKGYTFAGWNTQPDGKGTFYEENAYVKNLTKKADEVVTLYAQWKAAQYQITYNLNGGKNNKKNPKTYKITSKTIKLSNPSKKGYVFKGWYCDKKCTKKVTSIKKGSTGKVTLYAKWAKEKYTITYKLNGGKNNKKNPKIYTITSKMIKLAAPTRKGYVFKGWYRDKKCTRKVTSIKKGSTGKITLYAKWKKK